MSRGFKIVLIVFFGIWGYIVLSDIAWEFLMRLQQSGQPPWIINSIGLTIHFLVTLLPFIFIGACFKRAGVGVICGIAAFLACILFQALAS